MNLIDAENQMSMLTSGEALFTLTGHPNPQVVFLVRESSAVIKYFGETGVEVKAGLFPIGRVAVVAVVFRVGRYVRQEYVTWFDYHRKGSEEIFQAMTAQDFLSFHFYGDNGRRDRTFVATNPLGDFFATAIDTIRKLPAWSEHDFLVARLKVCSQSPTPRVLWETVTDESGKE